MTRDEMIDVLVPELVHCGFAMATARRRLWGMSRRALERELLLRGLVEYDDTAQLEEDCDDPEATDPIPAVLGWSCSPVYAD
jgi:hypothetical protein